MKINYGLKLLGSYGGNFNPDREEIAWDKALFWWTEIASKNSNFGARLFDNTTLSNVTARGANISFKNGGFIVASGSHPLGEVQQFGFDDNNPAFKLGYQSGVSRMRSTLNAMAILKVGLYYLFTSLF